MIDNTSLIDSGSGSSTAQVKAITAHEANVANASQATKTDNVKAVHVVSQVKESKAFEKKEVDPKEVERVVEHLNAFVQLMKRNVSFSVDKTSGRDVISVFEAETKELIRQIPSEEALKLLKRMDVAVGLLFSEKV